MELQIRRNIGLVDNQAHEQVATPVAVPAVPSVTPSGSLEIRCNIKPMLLNQERAIPDEIISERIGGFAFRGVQPVLH